MPLRTIDQPPAKESDRRQWPRAVAVAVGLTALAFVCSLVAALGAILALRAVGVSLQSTASFVVLLVASQGSFLALAALYVRGRVAVPVRVPTRRDAGWIAGGVVLGLVVALVLGAVRVLLFPETDSVVAESIARDADLLLYLAVFSVLLVAPAEELLFRGAIQGRLRTVFGPVAAVLGASTTFGLMHLLNFTGPVAGGLAAAGVVGAVSVVWGYAYERTRNLLVPVLAHGLYNATLMGVGYLSVATG